MPWRDPSIPSEIRNAIYDAYVQGVRLREAGWPAERAKSEGLKEMIYIPNRSVWVGYRKIIEGAFWERFQAVPVTSEQK